LELDRIGGGERDAVDDRGLTVEQIDFALRRIVGAAADDLVRASGPMPSPKCGR